MSHTSDLKDWLAENPKMMGALWMMILLLSQAGSAVAGSGGARAGP